MKQLAAVLMVLVLMVSTIFATGGKEDTTNKGAVWPTKAINVVVPAAAGGDTDYHARIFGKYIEKTLGQPVVITNVGGAGGTVGTLQVMDARPDGNTILFFHGSALLNTLMGVADFDIREEMDIANICVLDNTQIVLTNPKKFKSWQEVVEKSKTSPESVIFGRESGTAAHLAVLALEDKAGIKFNQVDIAAGFANLISAIMGEHIDIMYTAYGNAKQYMDNGNLKMVGVFSNERLASEPTVPTFKEQGVDVAFEKFFFYAFPKGTPKEIIQKFNNAVEEASKNPECKKDMEKYYLQPSFMNPEETKKYMDNMWAFYQKYVSLFN